MRSLHRVVLLGSLLAACTPAPSVEAPPSAAAVDLAQRFDAALSEEARSPLSPMAYLDVVDAAVAQPADPHALAALTASLDALLWRQAAPLDGSVAHAVVHRRRINGVAVSQRLQRAWDNAGTGAPSHPAGGMMRALIAAALHDLALRVGDEDAAVQWRGRSGCVASAAVVGPLSAQPLQSLRGPSPLPADAAMPPHFPGLAPFAAAAAPVTMYANACAIDVSGVSPVPGMRLLIVDVDNPKAQRLQVSLSADAAVQLDAAGTAVLTRDYAAGTGTITSFASLQADAGRLRWVARIAPNHTAASITLRIVDAEGQALASAIPHAGEQAAARVSDVNVLPLVKVGERDELALAGAALLAVGQTRLANDLFVGEQAPKAGEASLAAELVKLRAFQAAHDMPRNQNTVRIEGLTTHLRERCASCWEPQLVQARLQQQRRGVTTGAFAGFDVLKIGPRHSSWQTKAGPMQLLYASLQAHRSALPALSRNAFDATARRMPGSMLEADLDGLLHHRIGPEAVRAACEGGSSRASHRCVQALLAQGEWHAAARELRRLRRLVGDPAVLRATEIRELLARGHNKEAIAIFEALAPGRKAVALLGIWVDDDAERPRAVSLFKDSMRHARDAPWGYSPLARLLGVVKDRSAEFEAAGAALVKRDRAKAFLPGAGTAVLKRDEDYDLLDSGLLHYWIYDLRRVSGTADVAGGTRIGMPLIEGRSAQKTLRRRIYKKDGRIIDPDPGSRGAQMQTDLSQLQTGDYVEVLAEGWALPNETGQLVVDTPDVLPQRTSARKTTIRLRRPAKLDLSQWSHPMLGKPQTRDIDGRRELVWTLENQAPRTFEGGVAPLEGRVAISFGTDSWKRIARQLGERYRGLVADDPAFKAWVSKVAGDESVALDKKIGRIVAAAGEAIPRADGHALSDFAASMVAGPQRVTARSMLAEGAGSRSWIIHQALGVLGVESEIAVSETRPFSAAAGFPARVGRFGHPLVRARVNGELLWIDADVDGPPLPPGRVSSELRDRQALLVDGQLVKVEAAAGIDPDLIRIDLTLAENGDASGTFKAQIFGRPAQQLAQAFERVVGADRDRLLRNVVLAWLPWADVRSVSLASDEGSWAIALSAEVTIVGFAQPEGRDGKLVSVPGLQAVHRIFPRGQATSLSARYAQQANRQTALAIAEPQLYRVTRRLQLPANMRVVHRPEAVRLSNPQINANRRLTIDGNALQESFELNLPVGTVSAADYATFAAQLRDVDSGFMHTLRLSRDKDSAKPKR